MTTLLPGAKINLGLRITGRCENGYHELESIFYPLPFPHDKLVLKTGSAHGFSLSCGDSGIAPRHNILCKVYELFAKETGESPAVKAELTKGIPMGAGLGGGSSDAAAFLLWLNEFHGQPLKRDELARLAARIGSDVPFFLINSPSLARGTGDIITPVSLDCSGWFLVLVWPDIQVGTAWAYSAWDALNMSKGKDEDAERENSLTKQKVKYKNFLPSRDGERYGCASLSLHNDLERPVFQRYPQLEKLKKDFIELGAAKAAMSGSGSTVFGLFNCKTSAQKAARAFLGAYRRVFFAQML